MIHKPKRYLSDVSSPVALKNAAIDSKREISIDKKVVSVSVPQKHIVSVKDSNVKKQNWTFSSGCAECLNGNTCQILHRVVTCYGQKERCEKDHKITLKLEETDYIALNHKINPHKYTHNTGDPSNEDI